MLPSIASMQGRPGLAQTPSSRPATRRVSGVAALSLPEVRMSPRLRAMYCPGVTEAPCTDGPNWRSVAQPPRVSSTVMMRVVRPMKHKPVVAIRSSCAVAPLYRPASQSGRYRAVGLCLETAAMQAIQAFACDTRVNGGMQGRRCVGLRHGFHHRW
ncbi:hypothetical protein G6F63_015086 [Rhizopus arrhizus]|nr:hypothetical protein G6F63_015086 [Rhizopus arrhizus]